MKHFKKMRIKKYTNEKLFDRILNNKSNKNYWSYIIELRNRKTDDVFVKSVALTKSEILKEKIIGINILAQFGIPRQYQDEILDIYFNLLSTEIDKNVISSVLYAIGHNNNKLSQNQINSVCNFVNHESTKVRQSLVFALLSVENIKAIKTLVELTKDKNVAIKDWATFGIGVQISTDNEMIRKALWQRINDEDQSTRFEAILGLALRKDKNIKEVLKNELFKIDGTGSLILEAIEVYNDRDFIPLIEEQIKINKKLASIDEDWLLDTLNKLRLIS